MKINAFLTPALNGGNSPPYPLGRRMSGPQSWSGRGGEEENIPAHAEYRTPVVQPVAHALYLLSFSGS
jgi:hypothetical protein